MSLSRSLRELERAWKSRIESYEPFATLVGEDAGGAVRLYRGWPKELLEDPRNDDLPRVTWFVAERRRPLGSEPAMVLIQSDLWVWPDDADGGDDLLDAIDDAMLDRLTGADGNPAPWFDTVSGLWVSSKCLEGSDPESALLRRSRRWEVCPA